MHATPIKPEFARDAGREFYNNRRVVLGHREVEGRGLPGAVPEEGLVRGAGPIAGQAESRAFRAVPGTGLDPLVLNFCLLIKIAQQLMV